MHTLHTIALKHDNNTKKKMLNKKREKIWTELQKNLQKKAQMVVKSKRPTTHHT